MSSSTDHYHWGGIPPLDHGSAERNLRLARGSADSVCLCVCYSLHHAPRTHTQPRTLTTPLHATALRVTPTTVTPLHLNVISVLAINSLSRARYWDSSRQPQRIDGPPTFTQTTPLSHKIGVHGLSLHSGSCPPRPSVI